MTTLIRTVEKIIKIVNLAIIWHLLRAFNCNSVNLAGKKFSQIPLCEGVMIAKTD